MEQVESKNVYRFDKDYFQHWFLSINDTGFSVSMTLVSQYQWHWFLSIKWRYWLKSDDKVPISALRDLKFVIYIQSEKMSY